MAVNRHRKNNRKIVNGKSKWWLVAAIVGLGAVFCVLFFTTRGRMLGRRLPFYDEVERTLFGGPRMPFAPAYGLDVSRYQKDIDWERINRIPYNIVTRRQGADEASASAPISFVVIKATEGGSYADPNLEQNEAGIRGMGVTYGSYHVMTMKAASKAQADNYVANSKLKKGDLAPVIDLEEGILSQYSLEEVRKKLKEILALLETKYGAKPIIYSSVTYGYKLLAPQEFAKYPKWIARYRTDVMPDGASIWQFTENGEIAGISQPVDINAMYVELASLMIE